MLYINKPLLSIVRYAGYSFFLIKWVCRKGAPLYPPEQEYIGIVSAWQIGKGENMFTHPSSQFYCSWGVARGNRFLSFFAQKLFLCLATFSAVVPCCVFTTGAQKFSPTSGRQLLISRDPAILGWKTLVCIAGPFISILIFFSLYYQIYVKPTTL